jgi:hypothetical protein
MGNFPNISFAQIKTGSLGAGFSLSIALRGTPDSTESNTKKIQQLVD